jgi:phosphate transport system permease protein
MLKWKTSSTRSAKRRDKIARWIITSGGITIIASVVAILALIVGVTIPLFQTPRSTVVSTCRLPNLLPASLGRGAGSEGGSVAPSTTGQKVNQLSPGGRVIGLGIDMGIDGRNVVGVIWSEGGTLTWGDLRTGNVLRRERLASPTKSAKALLRQVESLGAGKYALTWSDGSASMVEIVSEPADRTKSKAARHAVRSLVSIPAMKPRQSVASPLASDGRGFVRRSDTGAITRTSRLADGTIAVFRQVTTETPLGDEEVSTHQTVLQADVAARIQAMTMDREGNTLYAGTHDGRLIRWQLDEKGEVAQREVVRAFSDERPITALAMALGDASLAVGDANGGMTIWSQVNADGTRKLRLIHQLRPHRAAVRAIIPSGRNKSLLSLDQDGVVHLDHATSERHLLSIVPDGASPLVQLAFGPRGDALLGLDASGRLTAWHIDGGCPEINLGTLFGKVFYEGYDDPQYVWQTTGGEDFEPKYSLVPLVFGTLKGTFYAMCFAAPLALAGAMYVSYFTTPGFRRTIKPVVEIMATVPSVVIGFIIALWLAPILELWILAFFISLVAVPATFAGFMVLWQLVRRFDWASRVENGYEFLVVLPVLIAGVVVAACLATPLESCLFGGNFRHWLFEGPLASRYDQRNSILIAFGLGFTVIPIIFSIAEDSLSNVPYSMTAASMAVGASRWQTLWRVVLPSASPGIFAAMMIGFGRAVGETMIVLMATGNTPILSWSPLDGMRTLSANIAVEIPEAPVGGTLYRVLFLCAVLLFLLTFTVNTAAELVRQRLRKRFGRF